MQIPNNTQSSIINNQAVLLIFAFCLVIGNWVLIIVWLLFLVSWMFNCSSTLDYVNTIFRIVTRGELFVKGFLKDLIERNSYFGFLKRGGG